MAEELEVRRIFIHPRVGKNLPAVLSRSLVPDPYAAVSELVCNAYDEDAEHVHVNADGILGRITVCDDGNGMDKGGLESFFRLGDSKKLEEPFSPVKRRRRVGKYGVAKVLIQYLGSSFGVESVKDNRKYVISEGVTDRELEVIEIPLSGDVKSGTVITINHLRFSINTPEFDIKKLCSRLQWDPPNQPDFDIFVNGCYIKKRGVITYAQTYRVEKDLGGGRVVRGRIYHLRSPGKRLDGVRIYVHNRAVGDEKMFSLGEISPALARGRLQGVVHADFLEPFITLDRSDFQEDPLVNQTIEAVRQVVAGIKQDLDQGSESRTAYHTGRGNLNVHIDRALGSAQEEFNRKLGTDYTLALSHRDKAGPVAQVDPDGNIIHINVNGRAFTFLDKTGKTRSRMDSEIYLKRAFLTAATFAHTAKELNDDGFGPFLAQRMEEVFSSYQGISRITNLYNEKPILIPLRNIYLNPYRLYNPYEVSVLTGRPFKVIRLLHTSGALAGTEDHLFDKEGIQTTFSALEGFVSAIEIVDSRYVRGTDGSSSDVRVVYTRPRPTPIDEYLDLNSTVAEQFNIVNIGKIHPLFFVPELNSDNFRRFAEQNGIYLPRKQQNRHKASGYKTGRKRNIGAEEL